MQPVGWLMGLSAKHPARSSPGASASDFTVILLVALGVVIVGGLWVGGQTASVVSGHGWARGTVTAGVNALWHRGSPGTAWQSAMPGAGLYWAVTAGQLALLVACGLCATVVVRRRTRAQRWVGRLAARPGMATAGDIARHVGRRALRKMSAELRPRTPKNERSRPEQLGWRWGRARGVEVWTSVRDAVVLLGPSGSGKGVYAVNSRILDAPGAVVATSIRPDVLQITMTARKKRGPVGVIAADGSAGDIPEIVKWSPILGARDGSVATARATVLSCGSSSGVEHASFWEDWTQKVVKALLHAADWGGSGIDDLWRWSQSPSAARAAVEILEQLEGNPHEYRQVEPGWAATLASVVDGDEKFRGNVWAGVAKALAGLDLWDVRRRFDPGVGEQFDPAEFILDSGTLYLLAKEDDPASRLLQCLVDDIARVGKSIADRSPNARLDPPLTLVLDEIANFAPLPALPTYVSGYGGSGMVTMVVIQGRSQMARTWGSDAAKAIWDSATITGILGGVTSAEDLRDFCAIAGQRDELSWQGSTGHGGGIFGGSEGRTYSEHVTQRAVLDEGEIRGLPEGTMLMFYKGMDPMLVKMTAYYRRKDAKRLAGGRVAVQQSITHAERLATSRRRP